MAPCCLPSNAEHSVGLTTHPLPSPVVLSSTNQCKEGPTGIPRSQLSVFFLFHVFNETGTFLPQDILL